MTLPVRRRVAGCGRVAVPLALALPIAVVAPGAAQAASGSCAAANRAVTDDKGRTWPNVYYCGTYVSSALYANVAAGDTSALDDSGYMYKASKVWIVCQLDGRQNPTVDGNTNTWWEYTQGDESRGNTHGRAGAWGFLPATAVSQGGQNAAVPGVPSCPASVAPTGGGTSTGGSTPPPQQTTGSAPPAQQTTGSAPGGTQTLGSTPGGTQTFGSTPSGTETFGSAPGGTQTFGSAPGGTQTFGSAPAFASVSRTVLAALSAF